jgi:hypothetical protein
LQLTPALETLGPTLAGATLNLRLNPATDKTFINSGGNTRAYITHTFKVPSGIQHLDAAIAFQAPFTGADSPLVLFALLDPAGNQAAYSIPQGSGSGYGHVDVVTPAAGTWTVVVWTRPTGQAGSYKGPVQFIWAAENYVKFGSVSPARLNLAPGVSESVTAQFAMPTQPGDVAAAVRFSAPAGTASLSEIPVSLRTLIPVSRTGGSFTGTLTGGNGRNGAGPTQTFEFNVPNGINNMNVLLQITDNLYLLEGVLVDPQGMQMSVQPNLDPDGNQQFGLQLFHDNPQPGRWHFVLLQNLFSSGNQTTLPFTARIGFDDQQITAHKLPNSPSVKLSASKAPVVIPVQVINNAAVTEAFFADARLSTFATSALTVQACDPTAPNTTSLPGVCGQFLVPTEVNSIQFIAQSPAPIQLDALNDVGFVFGFTGSPELFGKRVAPGTAVSSLSEPEIPWGAWDAFPALIGPFGKSGAPTAAVTMTANVLLQAFDTAASADSGDIWADVTLGTNTFNPLILATGQAGTINVTITPDPAKVGQTVSGYLYIDTFNGVVGTGDEVVRIPYSYTVAP